MQCGRGEDAAEVVRRLPAGAPPPRASRGRSRAPRAPRASSPSDEAFPSWFEQALRWHESTPDTFERARSELAYGERLRRARRRGDARAHLRAAFTAFHQLGAEPWAERARLELAATGETTRKRDPSTLDQLTPRELQIALDLASGLTTREAAAKLYLSPKTVEFHLRSVYRKLGIASRAELAEAFARADDVTPPDEARRSSAPRPLVRPLVRRRDEHRVDDMDDAVRGQDVGRDDPRVVDAQAMAPAVVPALAEDDGVALERRRGTGLGRFTRPGSCR